MSKKTETNESYSYNTNNQNNNFNNNTNDFKESVNRSLDEAKDNIRKSIDESKNQIPRIQQHCEQLPGTVTPNRTRGFRGLHRLTKGNHQLTPVSMEANQRKLQQHGHKFYIPRLHSQGIH